MKDKYIDLIEQSFDFPQDEFSVEDNELNLEIATTILEEAGYMQVTPAYNGSSNLLYGIYFKTGAALSSAYGSNSIIIHVPETTSFSLTYNSNVADRSGAATVSVIRLTRKE